MVTLEGFLVDLYLKCYHGDLHVLSKDIFPDKATERKILSFIIKCSSDGCEWTGELREKEVWYMRMECHHVVLPIDSLLFGILIAELQRAKRASGAPWVRNFGKPSSQENLVIT